jgi:hypothetical protein
MTQNADYVRVIDAARRLIDIGVMDDDEHQWYRPSASLNEALDRLHTGVVRSNRVSCGCEICVPPNGRSEP